MCYIFVIEYLAIKTNDIFRTYFVLLRHNISVNGLVTVTALTSFACPLAMYIYCYYET